MITGNESIGTDQISEITNYEEMRSCPFHEMEVKENLEHQRCQLQAKSQNIIYMCNLVSKTKLEGAFLKK